MKPIKDFDGLYSITDFGGVYSHKQGRFLKPVVIQGYHIVVLHKNGVAVKKRVHRLVAEAFIENTNNLPIVDHINMDTSDNIVKNLRWCSRTQNGANRNKPRGKWSSKYKGVHWDKKNRKWAVHIYRDNKSVGCGRYETEEEAARVFNEHALSLYGEFARLNQII